MSALVLDTGALIAVDRSDRSILALLGAARQAGLSLRTNANVVAQVWRDPQGRQVELGRLLRSVEVRPVDEAMGRKAGELLARAGATDVVGATVALTANPGDQLLTSDRRDLEQLVRALNLGVDIIDC